MDTVSPPPRFHVLALLSQSVRVSVVLLSRLRPVPESIVSHLATPAVELVAVPD
jgi:hypothetical protein